MFSNSHLHKLSALLICMLIAAQVRGDSFKQISIEQGLPGSNIRKVFQDDLGYLWFGVEAVGLCRYDGSSFIVKEYDPAKSNTLSNNFIWDIASEGNDLWIATENGLNYYLRSKNEFLRFFGGMYGLPDDWVMSLLKDSEGNLWIGTNSGLCLLSKKEISSLVNAKQIDTGIRFIPILDHPENPTIQNTRILCLYEDPAGKIWAGTDKGIYIFSKDGDLLRFLQHNPDTPNSLVHDYVNFVVEYQKGIFLIGTDRGICKYYWNKDRFEQLHLPSSNGEDLTLKGYYDFLRDSHGVEWIGMSEGIFMRDPQYDGDQYRFIAEGEYGLSSNIIRDIIEDNSGQVWVGTKFGGLHLFKRHQQLFPHFTIQKANAEGESENVNHILSLLSTNQNDIWVGSKHAGLFSYSRKTDVFTSYWIELDIDNPSNSNRIECLYEDSKGRVWFGTRMGLNRIEKSSGKITLIPGNPVRYIYENSEELIWVGTKHGVFTLQEAENKLIRFESQHDFFCDSTQFIYRILEDSHGNTWFGTWDKGIFKYNREADEVDHLFHLPGQRGGIAGNMIREIYEDIQGRIWIGTKHNGLNMYHPELDSFLHITKSDGLPSNTIYCIQADREGDLWIGSHHGLSKMDIETLAITNYDESHGLQSNIFENNARSVSSDGYLLFGGKQGFNIFHPADIVPETFAAPLVINTLSANNEIVLRDIHVDTAIVLGFKQNFIDLEFALLDFRNPTKNKFRYKMEGVDNQWIESNQRNYVSYSDLKPGNYQFRVQALSMDNGEYTSTLNTDIRITPPIWKTRLAIIIYFLLAMAGIYGAFKIVRMREAYAQQLQAANKQIQRNIENNESKLRFFTNISHELQAPLALIIAPLEKLLDSLTPGEEENKYIALVKKNVERMRFLIDELMYFRKTEKEHTQLQVRRGDLNAFLKEITLPFAEYALNHDVHFEFKKSGDYLELWFDPEKMEKIISNLLMNAFKYTPAGGKVTLWIESSMLNLLGVSSQRGFGSRQKKREMQEVVNIEVSDTGKGMDKKELQNIFQRFYSKQDSRDIKGTGIGLELTKTLVEMHGGKISVSSIPGQGSTFTVSMLQGNKHFKKVNIFDEEVPVQKYLSAMDYGKLMSDNSTQEKADTDVSAKIRSKDQPLILVVEDNKDLRNFLGENLSEEYSVLLASDGKQGEQLAISRIPDLIISDVMMPEMDGIQLCQSLKTNVATSHVPIILLTRKTLIEDKIAALERGADDYVEKPFNLQYLMLRIGNLLNTVSKIKKQIGEGLGEGKIETDEISVYDKKLLIRCRETLLENISNADFSVSELSTDVGLSRSQLYRKLMALTGQTPAEFLYTNRLMEAKRMLVEEKYSVSDVAHLTGFRSSNSFSTVFKKKFGVSPSNYIANRGHASGQASA